MNVHSSAQTKLLLFSLLNLCATTEQSYADESGLKTFVAVDLTGEAFRRDKEKTTKEAQIRGAELYLSGPIDPIFDGSVGFAAHPEGGISAVELHEATISSSKLIPLTNIRVGQAFLGLGKLNSTHQHDWPFISAPKVHETFFDAEGLNDLLAEFTTNIPSSVPLALTLGVAKGWTFGHSHNAGSRPLVPTHYARLQSFSALPKAGGVQVGLNYLGRTDSKKEKNRLVGVDVTAKWREGRTLRALVQAELWHRSLQPAGSKKEDALGLYVFPQSAMTESATLGLRYDFFRVLNQTDAFGQSLNSHDQALVPTISYKPSEFSTFRLAYAWELTKELGREVKINNGKLELQSTFVLGAHPAHEY